MAAIVHQVKSDFLEHLFFPVTTEKIEYLIITSNCKVVKEC